MNDDRFEEMNENFIDSIRHLKVLRDALPDGTDAELISGVFNFKGVRNELSLTVNDIVALRTSMEETARGIGKGSETFKNQEVRLIALNAKRKELNGLLQEGIINTAAEVKSGKLLTKELKLSADLIADYPELWAKFKEGTKTAAEELKAFALFEKEVSKNAEEATNKLVTLTKEQEKMASSLKKSLIDSGIGFETAAAEATHLVDALVAVTEIEKFGLASVTRTQLIQANADAFVAALTAAQAFRVELDKQELEILRIAIDFVVAKDDKIDADIFKGFQAEIKLEANVALADAHAEALRRTVAFMKELEIGAGLVVDETKRLKDVALQVNEAFTNVIDVEQFDGAAEIISKNFTEKMIANMDPETYAALFSQAVQEHFNAQPVDLITPEMYAPQLAELEEKFKIAMENSETSSAEFAVAFAGDIQFVVGMMNAAGVEIEEKWLAMFELLKENRLRLYNEEQRDADILNMEDFAEKWKEKWAQLVETQLTNLAVISAQALLTGKDFAASFKRFTQQVVSSLIRMLIQWLIQRIVIGKAVQILQAKEATQALTSGVAQTGVNTMASMSLAPYPINLTAPLQALIHMGIAAGIAGLAAVGNVAGSAHGGLITGPGGPTADLIPRFLSNREFVIQASAVDQIGVPFLNALNTTPQAALAGAAGGTGAALSVPFTSGGGSMTKILQVVIQQTFTGDNWSENGISDDLREAVVEGAREAIEEGTELEFPTEVQ